METREQYEKRMQQEYEAYVSAQKANGHYALNYMNWLAGRKIEEKQSVG